MNKISTRVVETLVEKRGIAKAQGVQGLDHGRTYGFHLADSGDVVWGLRPRDLNRLSPNPRHGLSDCLALGKFVSRAKPRLCDLRSGDNAGTHCRAVAKVAQAGVCKVPGMERSSVTEELRPQRGTAPVRVWLRHALAARLVTSLFLLFKGDDLSNLPMWGFLKNKFLVTLVSKRKIEVAVNVGILLSLSF